ncbi:MAG: EpsG family protein [Lachnospiraceae bacterium]|nr:EpsG family protein [Lachnospiraceae bacterium]
MEKSALVYVVLTMSVVLLGTLVRNREYAAAGLRGGWKYGGYRPLNREQARNRMAEFAVYCLLAGVSACRIAVGNDYWVYRENFKIIAQNRHVASEIGFNYVVKALIWLFGYDNYLPVFGFFSLVTVFFFVRALGDQARDYALSLFLLMTGGYYFNSLNSVRYYLALAVALYSVKFVLRREFGKFLLTILAACLFHKTVLLVIPVYLLAYYLAWGGIKKWHVILGAAFLGSLIFGQDLYRMVIFKIYPYYENTHFDVGRISYANLAKCLGTLALCGVAWFLKRKGAEGTSKEEGAFPGKRDAESIRYRFLILLTVFGLCAFCCGGFVPEVTRIGYYMIATQIFLIPEAILSMKEGIPSKLCKWGVILAFGLYFVLMLRKMYDMDVRLLPYLNWIFN